jgi:gliding motility-associated-like protein
MRSKLLLLILLLSAYTCSAQLKLQLGEQYLKGISIKKLQVSPEDYTIWALAEDQKVYYKKANAADFELYTPVTGLPITDLAGYSFDEMYFVAAPKSIIRIKNGVNESFEIPKAAVTKITGITIFSPNYNIANFYYGLRGGWLAIGTDNSLFSILKGGNTVILRNEFSNNTEPKYDYWDYLRSSFKGATLIRTYPIDYCDLKSSRYNNNLVSITNYWSGYRDHAPYPNKINTGLMSLHPIDILTPGQTLSYNMRLEFWGTDQGLYGHQAGGCYELEKTRQYFTDKVNGTSEAYALSRINPQHYILAATDKGLQYSPSTVFGDKINTVDINLINFIKLNEFPSIKATDVLVDSRKDPDETDFVFVCDRVAWVSTVDGVYKVYLNYGPDLVKKVRVPYGSAFNNKTPPSDADGNEYFDKCDDFQSARVTLQVKSNTLLRVSWFKDDVELPDWIGKQTVYLQQVGTYHAEVTSLCEGITIKSVNFTVRQSAEPQLTFNYPDVVTLCDGQTLTFATATLPGYTYRWYRNNELIGNATQSNYTAALPGQYRVEVSNCGTYFKSSKTVTLVNPLLTAPIITASQNSYCRGELAGLNIANEYQYPVKWYRDGTELNDNQNKNTINTSIAGTYVAKVTADGCEKSSASFNLSFNDLISFTISKSKEGPLCPGESVTLTASAEAQAYLWSTGATTRDIKVNKAGKYTVQLTSAAMCTSSQSTTIDVLPQASLNAIKDTVVCTIAYEKVRVYAQKGFSKYNWNGFETTLASYEVIEPGMYNLTATTVDGCTVSTVFNVVPWCKQIIIPNTFTPNGDGINDYWRIGGLENDPKATIVIFNRNGAQLLAYQGTGLVWDGRYKGADLPSGTYYYIVTTKNSKETLRGSVTILR